VFGVAVILLTHLVVGGLEWPVFLSPKKTQTSVGDFKGGLKVLSLCLLEFPLAGVSLYGIPLLLKLNSFRLRTKSFDIFCSFLTENRSASGAEHSFSVGNLAPFEKVYEILLSLWICHPHFFQ